MAVDIEAKKQKYRAWLERDLGSMETDVNSRGGTKADLKTIQEWKNLYIVLLKDPKCQDLSERIKTLEKKLQSKFSITNKLKAILPPSSYEKLSKQVGEALEALKSLKSSFKSEPEAKLEGPPKRPGMKNSSE